MSCRQPQACQQQGIRKELRAQIELHGIFNPAESYCSSASVMNAIRCSTARECLQGRHAIVAARPRGQPQGGPEPGGGDTGNIGLIRRSHLHGLRHICGPELQQARLVARPRGRLPLVRGRGLQATPQLEVEPQLRLVLAIREERLRDSGRGALRAAGARAKWRRDPGRRLAAEPELGGPGREPGEDLRPCLHGLLVQSV
mmetsp:Transcript_2718/g.10594  ORF Transcript_2718/g.10594 Transcript_2718/m.10594 type:complete len:200 (-) Transcript_2718:2450-3049(-)